MALGARNKSISLDFTIWIVSLSFVTVLTIIISSQHFKSQPIYNPFKVVLNDIKPFSTPIIVNFAPSIVGLKNKQKPLKH